MQMMNNKCFITHTLLILLIFNTFGCCNNSKNIDENNKILQKWEIERDGLSFFKIYIESDSSVWTTDNEYNLINLTSTARKKYNLRFRDETIKILDFTYVKPKRFYIIFKYKEYNHLASWEIGDESIIKIKTNKEPKSLQWIERKNKLWYIASDLSVNEYGSNIYYGSGDRKYKNIFDNNDFVIMSFSRKLESGNFIEVISLNNDKRSIIKIDDLVLKGIDYDNNVLLKKRGVCKKSIFNNCRKPSILMLKSLLNSNSNVLGEGDFVESSIKNSLFAIAYYLESDIIRIELYDHKID